MGILKEKREKIDSLYMSYEIDETYYEISNDGLATLDPDNEFPRHEWDCGKNSRMAIREKSYFADKNYFETFTLQFPRDLYRI